MPAIFSEMAALWKRELRALAPESPYLTLLRGLRPLRCLVRWEADGFELTLLEKGRALARSQMACSALSREAIQSFASGQARSRAVKIGLEVKGANCFRRRLDVPEQAVRDLQTILVAEIERKTPFNPKRVYSGHRILDRRDGRASVEHLIVKKDFVDVLLADARLAPSDLDFLSVAEERADQDGFYLRISERSERTPRRILTALAMTALGLGAIYAALIYLDQSVRVAALDEAIMQIRPRLSEAKAREEKAAEARKQDENFQSLRAAARFTDVWAELTKHLPDDCWVNELRVTSGANGEQLISISGFADSPAQLVRLLEEVGTFSNTLLGAAVTFDPVERKQRFSLQTVFHRRGNP